MIVHLCAVLDWFAVHLMDAVDDCCDKHATKCVRIGGGITADVQAGDTHYHGPHARFYRRE